jgi:hypothetical protein
VQKPNEMQPPPEQIMQQPPMEQQPWKPQIL